MWRFSAQPSTNNPLSKSPFHEQPFSLTTLFLILPQWLTTHEVPVMISSHATVRERIRSFLTYAHVFSCMFKCAQFINHIQDATVLEDFIHLSLETLEARSTCCGSIHIRFPLNGLPSVLHFSSASLKGAPFGWTGGNPEEADGSDCWSFERFFFFPCCSFSIFRFAIWRTKRLHTIW